MAEWINDTWTNVEDELPELGTTNLSVTIRTKYGYIIDEAQYLGSARCISNAGWKFKNYGMSDGYVTHWKPLFGSRRNERNNITIETPTEPEQEE